MLDHPRGRQLRQAGKQVAGGIGRCVRESGFPEHWRLFVLLVVLSFFGAGLTARALIAGFEDTWTELALASAQHENQELRLRQEILREQTEAALAQIEALETTQATYTRTP